MNSQGSAEHRCVSCKHWGGQGTIGTVKYNDGDQRPCMAWMFGDFENESFVPMPEFVVTYGSLGGAKGQLQTHKDFGCINYNSKFDE